MVFGARSTREGFRHWELLVFEEVPGVGRYKAARPDGRLGFTRAVVVIEAFVRVFCLPPDGSIRFLAPDVWC